MCVNQNKRLTGASCREQWVVLTITDMYLVLCHPSAISLHLQHVPNPSPEGH